MKTIATNDDGHSMTYHDFALWYIWKIKKLMHEGGVICPKEAVAKFNGFFADDVIDDNAFEEIKADFIKASLQS